MTKVIRQPRKSSDDYSRTEILEWVGAGPKRQGHWNLTPEQTQQFKPDERGIIHANFHFTRWQINEYGTIRWEETSRREYEEVKLLQEETVHRALDAIFATLPEPEFQIGDRFRIQNSVIEENAHYQELEISPNAVYTVEQWFSHKVELGVDDPHGHPDFNQEESANCIYTARDLPILIKEWEMIPVVREDDHA